MRLVEVIINCNIFDEEKYTLLYMKKYSINNVRGGSFSKIILSDENMITLKQIINGMENKCYLCGKLGHYANNCNKTNTI